MKVTLLGTGGSAGVPMIGGADGSGDWGDCDPAEPRNRRTRSSIVMETSENQRLLVDTSPDMRSQLLDCRIPGVDAILFTHAHADHITGIDDVRILNRIANRPLPAFATPQTLAEIIKRFGYAFRPWEPPHFYRPVLEAKTDAGRAIRSTPPGCRSGCSARTMAGWRRWACASAGLATRLMLWRLTMPRWPRWWASIPGWSAVSCARDRTGPMPTWRSVLDWVDAVKAAPHRADPYGHRNGLGAGCGPTCRRGSRPAMTA